MRSVVSFARAALIATSLLASLSSAGPRRAVLVRAGAPGPAAETTWVQATDAGVRVYGDGAGTRLAPAGPGPSGRWIVQLDAPALPTSPAERVQVRRALVSRFASELARREPTRFGARGDAGVRIVREYDRLIAGVALEAPATALAQVRAIPGVVRVDADLPVQASLDRSVPQVRGDVVRTALGGTGRGVRVGIVDTGVDYHHPAFGGAFGPGTRVAGGRDFVNDDDDPVDDNGHGTHVAGIVAGNGGGVVGMATEATLYAYKVLNDRGGGFTSNVMAALERCADPDQDPLTDDRLDVVNMSLGASGGDPHDAFSLAVDALDALGTTVVVAAGNGGGPFTIGDPAIASGALAVGAVTRADVTAAFSSRGPGPDLAPKPDMVAPGEGIVSAAIGGGKIALSGTSMAAPHVAGAAAQVRQLHPQWTHDEVRAALVGAAKNVERALFEQGAGRLDAYAAATATVLAMPTQLAFGRVLPGGGDTTITRALRVRSHAATSMPVTLVVNAERFPLGVDITVTPSAFALAAGAETTVAVRALVHATRAANRTPPFAAVGRIEVHAGAEVRHVPYSLHDCYELQVLANGGSATAVVHDDERTWPSKGFFEPTWLLPPGDFDAMAFGFSIDRPLRLERGIHLTGDRVVDVARTPLDRTVTWAIADEQNRPLQGAKMDLAIRHKSGAFLAYVEFPMVASTQLPEAGPDYRLEWAAFQSDGPVRRDIAGVVSGPFTTGTEANDPARLRRSVEHYTVAPGDSVVQVEFRMHPDGANGEFGLALLNLSLPPTTAPFDVVKWRSPSPGPGHYRLGRWDIQYRQRELRDGSGDALAGLGPLLSVDHGDTMGVHGFHFVDPPTLLFTGSRLSFGTGPLVFHAGISADANDFLLINGPGYSGRLFTDYVGSSRSGPATTFEIAVDGHQVLADSIEGEGRVLSASTGWQRQITLPPGNRATLTVHAPEASVLGAPSRTTVRTDFGLGSQTFTPALDAFAVIAGGSAVEEVRFGRDHDPHVEFVTGTPFASERLVTQLFCRAGGSAAWTALAVSGDGRRFRAALPPLEGPVSLRLRIGTVRWGTLEMDVEPAFAGRRSPGVDAPLLQASANATGVQVAWRVSAADGPLVVERTEADGPWVEWGEVTPGADGIAQFADAAVVAGARYGYRLAGGGAPAWVQVPLGTPPLSLAIAPNPAHGELRLALGVDHDAPITLALLDVQGRVLDSRVLTGLSPGVHVVNVTPPSRTKPGLYFVRLIRGSDVITRRVMWLR